MALPQLKAIKWKEMPAHLLFLLCWAGTSIFFLGFLGAINFFVDGPLNLSWSLALPVLYVGFAGGGALWAMLDGKQKTPVKPMSLLRHVIHGAAGVVLFTVCAIPVFWQERAEIGLAGNAIMTGLIFGGVAKTIALSRRHSRLRADQKQIRKEMSVQLMIALDDAASSNPMLDHSLSIHTVMQMLHLLQGYQDDLPTAYLNGVMSTSRLDTLAKANVVIPEAYRLAEKAVMAFYSSPRMEDLMEDYLPAMEALNALIAEHKKFDVQK